MMVAPDSFSLVASGGSWSLNTSYVSGVSQSNCLSKLPFGEELYAGTGGRDATQGYSGTDNVRQKFTGYERDGETGLDFAQARYYSSSQGRFTGVDPENAGAYEEDPQSWNGYAYAGNNPLLFTDPTGKEYEICKDGECYRHSDKDFLNLKKKNPEGMKFTGNGNFYESGNIIDGDGNVIGQYAQISIDDRVHQFAFQMQQRTQHHGEFVYAHQSLAFDLATLPRGILKGAVSVYRSISNAGKIQYVGITSNLSRRAAQHLKGKGINIEAIPGLKNLSREDARAVEQALIELHGLGKDKGSLTYNLINSIRKSSPDYAERVQKGKEILKSIGYPGTQ